MNVCAIEWLISIYLGVNKLNYNGTRTQLQTNCRMDGEQR